MYIRKITWKVESDNPAAGHWLKQAFFFRRPWPDAAGLQYSKGPEGNGATQSSAAGSVMHAAVQATHKAQTTLAIPCETTPTPRTLWARQPHSCPGTLITFTSSVLTSLLSLIIHQTSQFKNTIPYTYFNYIGTYTIPKIDNFVLMSKRQKKFPVYP